MCKTSHNMNDFAATKIKHRRFFFFMSGVSSKSRIYLTEKKNINMKRFDLKRVNKMFALLFTSF